MAKNDKKKYWLGFDLGGTKMMAVVYNDSFKEVSRERKKTKAQDGSKAVLARIVQTMNEALRSAGILRSQLAGIGVGYPALLDMRKGMALNAPNLNWKNIPIRISVSKAFKRPVFVINDVDAGLYGEYRFGAAKKSHCVVGIFPGTGVGGACINDGRLLVGRNSSCMEIGHLPMLPGGPVCGCGRRGCLETLASRLAVSAAAAIAAFRGEAPYLARVAGTDVSNIRSGMLADAVKAGDKKIEIILRDAARWLGRGVAASVNMLAPDLVVLGGGLVEAMPDWYIREVAQSADENIMPPYRGTFKIVRAKVGDDAVAMGAAAYARALLRKGW